MHYREQRLFFNTNGKNLSDYLKSILESVRQTINSEEESYILNIGQEQYINYLVNKSIVEKIEILEDNIFAENKEENISSEKQKSMYQVLIHGH